MKDMLNAWQEKYGSAQGSAEAKSAVAKAASLDVLNRSPGVSLDSVSNMEKAREMLPSRTEASAYFGRLWSKGGGCGCGGKCGPCGGEHALSGASTGSAMASSSPFTSVLVGASARNQVLRAVWSETIGQPVGLASPLRLSNVQRYIKHLPAREGKVAEKLIASVNVAGPFQNGEGVWDRIRYGTSYGGGNPCGAIVEAANYVWDLIFEGLEGHPLWSAFASWYRNCDRVDNPDPCVALGEVYAHCVGACGEAEAAHARCIQRWGERTASRSALGPEGTRRLCREQAREEASGYGVPSSLFDTLDLAATLDDFAALCMGNNTSFPRERDACVIAAYTKAAAYGVYLLFFYALTGMDDPVYWALIQAAEMASREIERCYHPPATGPNPSHPRPHRLRIPRP